MSLTSIGDIRFDMGYSAFPSIVLNPLGQIDLYYSSIIVDPLGVEKTSQTLTVLQGL